MPSSKTESLIHDNPLTRLIKKRVTKLLDDNDKVAAFIKKHPKITAFITKMDPDMKIVSVVSPIVSELRAKIRNKDKSKDEKKIIAEKYKQIAQEI